MSVKALLHQNWSQMKAQFFREKYIDLLSVLLHTSDMTCKSLDEFSLTFPNFSFD